MLAIAHLTSAHPPFDVRIFVKECGTLAGVGHAVTLVACHDQDEVRDGVRIDGVRKLGGRLQRMLFTSSRVARRALKSGADICHFHDPELIPAALFLKACGKTVIYDVHEDLPRDIEAKYWIPRLLRPIASKITAGLEALAAWSLDGIVAATPDIAQRFPQHKTVLVQNFAHRPPNLWTDAKPRPYSAFARTLLFISVGFPRNVGRSQWSMRWPWSSLILCPRFSVAGPFVSPTFKAELEGHEGWGCIDYRGVVDRAGVRSLLSEARVGLVVLEPTSGYVTSYPVKMFEYMAAGCPSYCIRFPFMARDR